MNQFIESLRRLYKMEKISKEKLDELLSNGKITRQEYDYIVPVENAI